MRFTLVPLFLLLAGSAHAQDSTRAGRFTVEHPTLHNLGFEWSISGDANRNASVAVEFRRAGEGPWRPALPLLRVGGERVFRTREHLEYTVPDGFAGSILNVEPGTEYECRFVLSDPDMPRPTRPSPTHRTRLSSYFESLREDKSAPVSVQIAPEDTQETTQQGDVVKKTAR
jgi:hypothetical protein